MNKANVNDVDANIRINLDAKRLLFENSIHNIEAVVNSLRHTLTELFVVSENMNDLEQYTLDLLTDYMQENYSVSSSLYVYYDPAIDNDVHDVWLTNESNGILRQEKIPLERYESQDNMAWFYDVKNNRVSHWIPPYWNRFNQFVTSYVMPIEYENQFLGIVGMYLNLDVIQRTLHQSDFDEDDHYWIMNHNNQIIYHPNLIEGEIFDGFDMDQVDMTTQDYIVTQVNQKTFRNYATVTTNGWWFIHSINEDLITGKKARTSRIFILSTVIASFIMILIVMVIVVRYRERFTAILISLSQIRKGEDAKKIPVHEQDELGEIARAVNSIQDRMYQIHHSLEQLAYKNRVTQLANWEQLKVDLEYYIRNRVAVLYVVDIDNYKAINDMIGKRNSDTFIKRLAALLQDIAHDDFRFYHINYDVFAFLEFRKDYTNIMEKAQIIHDIFEQYTYNSNSNFNISCAIGIAKFPDDASDPENFLSCAETALDQAKRSINGNTKVYSRFLSNKGSESTEDYNDIIQGLKNNEFLVHYQPIFQDNLDFYALEALVRWQHPVKGLLFPEDFMDLANKSGAINDIGEFVFRQVCLDITAMNKAQLYPHFVAVNISVRQLLNPMLISKILGIIRDYNIPPSQIEIEFIEEVLKYDRIRSIKKLQALNVAGVKVALDDFGTGDSAISNLKVLPLHRIKLDYTLVNAVDEDKKALNILKSIVELAHNLDLKVTAESVENQKQLDLLMKIRCDEFQGFYLSEPSNLDEIIKRFQ